MFQLAKRGSVVGLLRFSPHFLFACAASNSANLAFKTTIINDTHLTLIGFLSEVEANNSLIFLPLQTYEKKIVEFPLLFISIIPWLAQIWITELSAYFIKIIFYYFTVIAKKCFLIKLGQAKLLHGFHSFSPQLWFIYVETPPVLVHIYNTELFPLIFFLFVLSIGYNYCYILYS